MLNVFINRPMVCGFLGSFKNLCFTNCVYFCFFSYISNKGFHVFFYEITTVALTFVIYSINNLYSVPYEHIVTFRFERKSIFGIFVMIGFISERGGLFG